MITIEFTVTNEAFDQDPEGEACRILDKVKAQIRDGLTSRAIQDVNGNTIGMWSWSE